jgi:predicted peptidase
VKPKYLQFYKQQPKTLNLNFLLFEPDDDPNKVGQWPLLLFLHGAGERGENLESLLNHSIPDILKTSDQQFFLVAPQCPLNSYWMLHQESLLLILEELTEKYPIDTSRIYLTGVSMGAEIAWYLAKHNPQRFAAMVPVCGRAPWWDDFPQSASQLNQLPIWAFHGEQDSIIPVHHSRELVSTVEKANGNVRYTEYPHVDHDVWNHCYKNPELYEWLFKQERT